MPYRTGDIDELYGWSDDDDLGAYEMPEEKCVGTEASFEQLLARELAKEHGQNGCSNNTTTSTTAKSRRQFLKKGARGWWMKNATAKQKLQKHVLESVIMDENNQVAHYEVARQAKSPPKRRQRSPHTSSIGTASPEPARRDDVASVHISPVRLPPATRPTAEPPRRSLPMWANGHQNLRTDESIETLNMSRVRQDFEHQREREADELADFEALEQELAAEKASYLQEKRVIDDRRQGSTTSKAYEDGEDDNASWLRDSIDGASLHGDAQQFLASSFSNNLDLGGESAMVFEGDHRVFRSPLPQERPAGRESQRPRQSRRSFAPSEISAVSLNDSEPWGDANALDHFAHLPESPIAKLDTASIRRESLWNKEEEADRRVNNQDHFEDSQSYQDDDDEVKSTERGHARNAPSRHDAPISSLVQQVFGGAPQSEASWDDDVYQPSTQPPPTNSRQAVLRGSSKKPPNGPSSRPPRSVQGQKASRQSAPRNQRAAEEQSELPAPTRRRAPGFGSDGMLPVSIEEKLVELEEEVKFYKSETLQLQRKKAQYDDELQRLARDKENIVHYQDEQQQLIEQEWQRQRQKMKQDERLFERQMKLKLSAAASAGSRKDRAEMDALKAQIVALQLEAKQSSGKMKATNDVLRQRIADLEGKNRELSEEIKFLERDRLDQWQKYEDLLKELNSHKLTQDDRRDQLKTVGDISRVSRSAEELLSSLQFPNPDVTQSRSSEPSKSTASTPTYEHGDEYNPGQYRQAGRDQVKSVHSSHSSGKHNQDEEDDGGRQLEPNTRCEDDATVDEVVHPGGKREMTYRDGTKRIFFADGNEKEILPNGDVVIRFTNGDRKEFFPSTGVSVYHYHEAQTTLTTFPDKTKVYEFPNQQIEKSYLDGTTEIQFADGILKTIHPSGDEFSRFPDGTTMLETKDGLREVTLLNGKQVRYYPDGKMTLVNVDGQESEVRSDEELRELMETV